MRIFFNYGYIELLKFNSNIRYENVMSFVPYIIQRQGNESLTSVFVNGCEPVGMGQQTVPGSAWVFV